MSIVICKWYSFLIYYLHIHIKTSITWIFHIDVWKIKLLITCQFDFKCVLKVIICIIRVAAHCVWRYKTMDFRICLNLSLNFLPYHLHGSAKCFRFFDFILTCSKKTVVACEDPWELLDAHNDDQHYHHFASSWMILRCSIQKKISRIQ